MFIRRRVKIGPLKIVLRNTMLASVIFFYKIVSKMVNF